MLQHAQPPARSTTTAKPASATLDIGSDLTPDDIFDVAVGARRVHLGPEAAERMRLASITLQRMVQERRRIYGVTTGYGPLASHAVTPEHAEQLQRHLIYHLAAGAGAPLAERHVRATMAARAASLARGHSGIGSSLYALLIGCLNHDIVPVVPEMGTVGASGDLTPLAHIALALIGEGEVTVRGERMPSGDALRAANLEPAVLGHKEGITLVNGTSCMTGIAAVNAVRTRRLLALALRVGVVHSECLQGKLEAWDPRIGQARPHKGQRLAHETLAVLSRGSLRLVGTPALPPVLDESAADDGWLPEGELPQDPYTIRCLPQEIGAALDVLAFHDQVVTTELQSATDNPLIFSDDGTILHGGNFYGQHVAFASDALALAVIKTAIHAERCLARLTDVTQNKGLPAFLHGGRDGVNSGFMGAQVTATALVAEMRTRATAASIQSIPTNGNNQDVVTMGTIAARKTAEHLDLAFQVLAIQALAVAQAAELRGGISCDGFAAESRGFVAWVRSHAAALGTDRSLARDIASIAARLECDDWTAGTPLSAVAAA
jgi:tyrosine ammonia-lyase